MTTTISLPTREEMQAIVQNAAAQIENLTFVPSYTIADYPIGRRERGQCKMEVEYKKGKGFRMVRTTTDRWGHWCSPKTSTYREIPFGIVTGIEENEAAWLKMDPMGEATIYLIYANYSTGPVLLQRPKGIPFYTPRREPQTITWKKQVLFSDKPPEISHDVIPADPVEVCDAYDVWRKLYGDLCDFIEAKIDESRRNSAVAV